MTIAEQLRAEGMQQGINQGINQGVQQGLYSVVKNMLAENANIDSIMKFTKLSKKEIEKIIG